MPVGAVLELAKGLKRYTHTFCSRDDVDPVHFMIGSASSWGGLPDKDAQYYNMQPNLPVGNYELKVKDVPVKGFWSIMAGWNYSVRMYEPSQQIIDGDWVFPGPPTKRDP